MNESFLPLRNDIIHKSLPRIVNVIKSLRFLKQYCSMMVESII